MKRTLIAAVGAALIATTAMSAQATTLKTDNDKLSYTIGVDLGKNFKRQGIQVNSDILAKGVADAQGGADLQMTKEQMQTTLKNFQQQLMKKKQAQFKESAESNKKAGEEFLAKNKSADGVKSTTSGLQYKVLTAGNGDKPGPKDTVTVEYTGQLINGTVFDSTDKAGKPVSFRVNQVIPGWTEALQLMKAGATWQIFVPSNLAYGPRGVGGPIGPNETLIFKIHLISVKKG